MNSPGLFFHKKKTHPINDLLKIFCKKKPPMENAQENISSQSIPDLFKLPVLEKYDIRVISKNVVDKIPIPIALSSIRNQFQFNEILLKSFMKISKDIKETDVTLKFVYYFNIAWLSQETIGADISQIVYMNLYSSEYMPPNVYSFLRNVICSRRLSEIPLPLEPELLQILIPSFSDDDFSLIIQAIEHSILNGQEDSLNYLLKILSTATNLDNHGVLVDSLVNLLMHRFFALEVNVFDFIITLSQKTKKVKILFEMLPEKSFRGLEKAEFPSIGKIPEINLKEGVSQLSVQIFDGDDFKPKFVNEDLPSSTSLLIPTHQLTVNSVIIMLNQLQEVFCTAFFENFANILKEEPNRYDLYLDFIVLYIHPNKAKITDNILDIILDKQIFNSRTIFFGDIEPHLSIIRSSIIDFYSTKKPRYLPMFISKLSDNPYMLGESISRLISSITHTPIGIFNPNMFRALFKSITMLSSDSPFANEIRSTIYQYVFYIIEDRKIAEECFSSLVFTRGFFSGLFDRIMTNKILAKFSGFLALIDSTQSSDYRAFVEVICSVINKCFEINNTVLPIEVTQCVLNGISQKPGLTRSFKPLVNSLISFLDSKPTMELLEQALQLFLQMYLDLPDFSMTRSELRILSGVIQELEGTASHQTVATLLGMLSQSRSVKYDAMFMIQKPEILVLLFSVLGELIIPYAIYMLNLCKNSSKNGALMHAGELDLLLIEAIIRYPDPFNFRGCRFEFNLTEENIKEVILPLISQISSISSSQQVAQHLLALASPNESGEFPKFAVDTLDMISKALNELNRYPHPSMPIGFADPLYYINGITGTQIMEGFTVLFKVRTDVKLCQLKKNQVIIFSVLDDGNVAIRLFLNGPSMTCKVFTKKGVSSALLTSSFPSCVWTLCSISFRFLPNDVVSFEFSMNGGIASQFTVGCPKFSEKEVEIKIGSSFEGTPEEIGEFHPIEIGDFTVIPEIVKIDTVAQIAINESKTSDFSKILFTIPPREGIDKYQVKAIPDRVSTLIDVFTSSREAFTVFFEFINTMPPHFLSLLIDIMKNTYKWSELHPDFEVISNLLQSCNPANLTYHLFNKLFGLLEIAKNEEYLSSIIRNLIVCPQIWYCVPPKDFLSIIRAWDTQISSNGIDIMKYIPFRSLLAMIRIYFWYSPKESELIAGFKGERKRQDIDLKKMRAIMKQLIMSYTEKEYNEDVALVLISHCATCDDTKQCLLFLEVLRESAAKHPPMKNVSRNLFYLLQKKNPKIFVAVIKALEMTSGDEFPLYIEAATSSIQPFNCSAELLEKLIELIDCLPLSYPLMVLAALNLGEEYTQQACSALKKVKAPNIMNSSYWLLWPLLLVPYTDQTQRLDLVFFVGNTLLSNFSIQALDNCLEFIDLVSMCTGISFDAFTSDLLKLITDLNIMNENDSIRLSLFHITVFSQLVKLGDPRGKLVEEYLQSPFSQQDISSSPSMSLMANPDFSPLPLLSKQQRMTISTASTLLLPKMAEQDENLSLEKTKSFEIFNLDNERLAPGSSVLSNMKNVGFRKSQTINPSGTPLFRARTKVRTADDIVKMFMTSPTARYRFFLPRDHTLLNASIDLLQTLPTVPVYGDYIKHAMDGGNPQAALSFNDVAKNLYDFKSSRYDTIQLIRRRCYEHWKANVARYNSYKLNLVDVFDSYVATSDIDVEQERITDINILSSKRLKTLHQRMAHPCAPFASLTPASKLRKRFKCVGDSFMTPMTFFSSNTVTQKRNITAIQQKPRYLCRIVTIERETQAVLLVSPSSFTLMTAFSEMKIQNADIRYVLMRAPFHKPTALEFFFEDGSCTFLDFSPTPASDILPKFGKFPNAVVQTSYSSSVFKNSGATEQWLKGNLTNYEYLLRLNILCGRSFRHPSLYPIFPWVWTDFETKQYRDFEYPITAQTEEKRELLKERARESIEHAMYFTAPSNPMQIAHWMIRLEPFTSLHIEEEGGKFGHADRLFKSVPLTARQVSEAPSTWEATPEFYSVPEFLDDVNGIGLGDVKLPSWAETPFEFIYEHRKALESDYVKENLNKWIDLTFGVAINDEERCNLFQPLLCPDVWSLKESSNRALVETTLAKGGHIPMQVFDSPHPVKKFSRRPSEMDVSQIEVVLGKSLKYASFVARTSTVVAIGDDGSVTSFAIDFEDGRFKEVHVLPEMSAERTCVFKDGLIATSEYTKAFILRASGAEEICLKDVRGLYDSDEGIAVLGDGSIVEVTSQREILPPSYEFPTNVSVSSKFGIILACTRESFAVVYSLSGKFVSTLEIPGEPTNVLITPGWGFMMVATRESISLFSVNGEPIWTRDGRNLSMAASWTDERGFDYIAAARNDGRIFVFEAARPDETVTEFDCCGPVIALEATRNNIFAVTRDGRAICIYM